MERSTFIVLTDEEMMAAAVVGIKRNIMSINKDSKPGYGHNDENNWEINILGAMGELSFCKYYGITWEGRIGNYKKSDVGHNIQVKTTTYSNGRLIIESDFKDEEIYVLVIGDKNIYQIIGWIKAVDCKKEIYRHNFGRGSKYFVPQSMLNPFVFQEEQKFEDVIMIN